MIDITDKAVLQGSRHGEVGRIVGHRQLDVVNGQRGHAWLTAVEHAVIVDGRVGHTTQGICPRGHLAEVVGGVVDDGVHCQHRQREAYHHQQRHKTC